MLKTSWTITSNAPSWGEKVSEISYAVYEIIYKEGLIEKAFIFEFAYELPTFMAQAQKQNMRGDITKLSILAGALHGVAASFADGAIVAPVPIVDWKGQTPKNISNDRTVEEMKRHGYDLSDLSTHELDAIGIGLYYIGNPNASVH